MKLNKIAMTGVMSLAGLGLVGAGAHAVFTQNTTSAQTLTAGTMNVTLSSDGGTIVSGNNTANLVMAPVNAAEGLLRITEIPHSRSPKFPRGRAAWRA